ncbi:probable RNA-directed DNA polymerase from transposon BS [Caerostris darwini]|uniref:Probable RNA-directed DNA polymerase from transposon BS n=1 Tax=Caerostris darwini TaxID=1538125 RepID=A0AAV4NFA6_9ARAC|nr:probable RNA-directed DNA polymerase from transposon BS [Caerostris darwini]
MINPVKDDTEQFTKSLSETMLTIIKHHFTYDSLVMQTDDMNSIVGNLEKYKEILTQEVEEIISKIKLNKAPGPDNIPGEVVKEMYYANRNWFTDLFNKLLKSGLFPTSWKTANVVIIPKEKKDLNMAEHYRPICLLSSWGKTFDKLIAKRIVYYLEQINFFNSNQFGFRRKKSTITAIQNIKSFVYQASDENKMVCLISLDIKNAFNSVNWNLLKKALNVLAGVLPLNIKLQFLTKLYDLMTFQEELAIDNFESDSDCLLISTYCPPKGDLASHLEVLQAFLVKYPLFKIFICGDFNAKSRVWGKRNVDARGTQILAFCNAMDLTIQNSPSSLPTFDCSRGQSWIDLLLTKNLDTGISMEVTDDISNSDHNLFHFAWSVDHLPPPERIHITISQSNWLSVKPTIFGIIRSHSSSDFSDVNCLISTIQKEIAERLSTTSGRKGSPKRANGAVCWTRELRAKRSKTRALRRLYQKEKDPTIRTTKMAAFKRCQAEYKKLIIATKANKFKSFINSVTFSSFFGKNFKILSQKKKRHSSLNCILRDDGSITSSLQDSYLEILSFHFPYLASVDLGPPSFSSAQDWVPLSTMELEAVIEGIKPKKASGIDGLSGEIVKEVFYANPGWFTSLFNFLLSTGHFPSIWKWARIVLIPKEGRTLNHPQDFRPICILPCWGKVLDKVITERLAYHLECGKLLHDLQYGFRKQRSTINALQHIKDFILSARNKKHHTCLVSIDMANAFNSVDWSLLKGKIAILPIPDYLKRIIFSFLDGRTVS